jgi:undecaprenyl pyrophosphate synthase
MAGRQEIFDAVRDLLTEADAAGVSMAEVAVNLTAKTSALTCTRSAVPSPTS